MISNKTLVLLLAAIASGALCALSAMADMVPGNQQSLKAYQSLSDVELKAAKQPRLEHGLRDLDAKQGAYKEQLPMQLTGSVEKIKKMQYRRIYR